MRTAMALFSAALLVALPLSAQTPEIQKQVENKLKDAKKAQDKLDEQYSQALKTNPDIKVAEAKLREAEAEVTRVRLGVLQRLRLIHAKINFAKAQVDLTEARWQREKQIYAKGAGSMADLLASEAEMRKAQADLTVAEAELPYLLGERPGGAVAGITFSPDGRLLHTVEADGSVRIWDITSGKAVVQQPGAPLQGPAPSAPMPGSANEKLREALDTQFKVNLQDIDLKDALKFVQDRIENLNIHVSARKASEKRVSIDLVAEIPVGAFFQFLEDETGCVFIIRDYGIVVVDRDRLPPGAALLATFWRQKPAAKESATKPAKK